MSSNWADEVDGDELPQTFTDANGITTHIEFRINEDGKKVKVLHVSFHDQGRTNRRSVGSSSRIELGETRQDAT